MQIHNHMFTLRWIKLVKNNNNYVYGSEAPKIEYNVYEENEVLKTKKIHRSNYKSKIKMVLAILFILCCFLVLMYRYAFITELSYSVDKVVKNYDKIKNENMLLKIEIDKNLDLNKVREIAETKLGMHKPDKYQIVYVKVPKSDTTIIENSITKDIVNKGAIVTIIGKVSNFSKSLIDILQLN